MTPREILAFIREKEVKAVDLRFMDFPGQWQHFTIPAENLDEATFRGRPRLRRFQHPRLEGHQRIRHARQAGPRDGVHRSVLPRHDAHADLQHSRSADARGLHARSAQRRAQGRQLHEVDRASPTRRTSAPRCSSSSSTTCATTRPRIRRTTSSTASKAPGTPAATRSRISATSSATRKATFRVRRRTRCTICAPR